MNTAAAKKRTTGVARKGSQGTGKGQTWGPTWMGLGKLWHDPSLWQETGRFRRGVLWHPFLSDMRCQARCVQGRGNLVVGGIPVESPAPPSLPPCSSIMNVPGESTLRREFLRLQQENKSNSEALKQQQQQQLAAQHRDSEAHIKHLLHQRQRRIEEQKEERRRVEEVRDWGGGALLSNFSRQGLGASGMDTWQIHHRLGPTGGEQVPSPLFGPPPRLRQGFLSSFSNSAENGSNGSCRRRSSSAGWRTCR